MADLETEVVNAEGKAVGSLALNPAVFGAKIAPHLVQAAVRWQRAKRRAGTHSSQTKGDLQASDRKPWKQKGTGQARAGSRNSPLWVGGGVIFGPKPRSYEFKLTKKNRKQALASVLSAKVADKTLRIVDALEVKSGKTRDMQKILEAIGAADGGAVIVLPDGAVDQGNIRRSSRNIPDVCTLPVGGVNVYDLMKTRYVIATRESIAALEQRIAAEKGTSAEQAE